MEHRRSGLGFTEFASDYDSSVDAIQTETKIVKSIGPTQTGDFKEQC